MQEESTPALNRRRLLRRASTVAVGLGAAGVASAVVANPAAAAATDLGPTRITGDGTDTALELVNDAGPALRIKPTPLDGMSVSEPVGTFYLDGYGDVSAVGNLYGPNAVEGDPYLNMLYSPTWATMTVPIPPWRYFVSSGDTSKKYSGNIVSGKVVPTASQTDADLVLDFNEIFNNTGGVVAVQANLTVVGSSGGGYAALWDEGPWPTNSSINFVKGVPIANFTQTNLGSDLRMRLKIQSTAVVILDIVGFVLNDPFSQFADSSDAPASFAKTVKRFTARRANPAR